MKGLFIGLSTLDCIYLTSSIPSPNQKIVALDQTIAAGGPATNAAVTFNYLGNQAALVSVMGNHPISQLIRADLKNINLIDLNPSYLESPSVSSIIVTQATGDRAVVAINASKIQAAPEQLPKDILEGVDVVLIDGHQMKVSEVIAQQAKTYKIPVVIDGGSWKAGLETVLPYVDYALCSANFYPPNCHTQEEVLSFLKNIGIPYIAITQGEKPIIYWEGEQLNKINVPVIKAVDTLGAGDIFHGAFCHYILCNNFRDALEKASQVAAYSCQFFGTRQWMSFELTVNS